MHVTDLVPAGPGEHLGSVVDDRIVEVTEKIADVHCRRFGGAIVEVAVPQMFW